MLLTQAALAEPERIHLLQSINGAEHTIIMARKDAAAIVSPVQRQCNVCMYVLLQHLPNSKGALGGENRSYLNQHYLDIGANKQRKTWSFWRHGHVSDGEKLPMELFTELMNSLVPRWHAQRKRTN